MWQVQINEGTKSKPDWQGVRPSGEGQKPYEFETEYEAERMLRLCYPDQYMIDRGKPLFRIVEVAAEKGEQDEGGV